MAHLEPRYRGDGSVIPPSFTLSGTRALVVEEADSLYASTCAAARGRATKQASVATVETTCSDESGRFEVRNDAKR